MSQSLYKISIVESGKEEAWRDFWERGGKGENPGRVAYPKAKNLNEAIRRVQSENPGFTVMRGGSGRIGRC